MSIVLSKRGGGSYFLGYIKQRIEKNKNFLFAITGQTGSGKTYSALRIGELLDTEFSADRVVFSVREFMKLINSGTLKSGSVIILDEAGIALSSKQWQSVQNRLMNFVMQSFRHRNYIVIFTSPDLSFLDAASRKLLHSYAETQGIDAKLKVCKLKPFLLQTNQRDGMVYFKFLRVITAENGIVPLKQLALGLPTAKLIQEYEVKKTQFTTALNASIMEDLDDADSFKGKDLTLKQEEIIKLMQEGKTMPDLMEHLHLKERVIQEHMQAIERKGYKILRHKEGTRVLRYEVVQREDPKDEVKRVLQARVSTQLAKDTTS